MKICPEVREVPRRIINQKISYNRFLAWSEIESKETNNDINFNKIIMFVVKPRPTTRTIHNMERKPYYEWLTTTVPRHTFNLLMKKQYHLKDQKTPPKPFKIVLEDDFLFY